MKRGVQVVAILAALVAMLFVQPGKLASHGTADEVRLDQNYPNPFNGTTEIKYQIPRAGHVQLSVYNMLGQEIQGLVDQDEGANEYRIRFDGNNLPSGQYTYRMIYEADGNITKLSHKMYLVK